jgi:anti-sigma regulatory factor (Ser/Thr protein kinase)
MAQEQRVAQPAGVPLDARSLYACDFGRDDLGGVRTALARLVGEHGLADRAQFNFILVVNELTTNVIRHGGGRGCVRLWRHGDQLWCEVADTGPGIPAPPLHRMREPRPGPRGHGLWLTQHICADVHIDTGRHGTRILLRYPLSAPRSVQ